MNSFLLFTNYANSRFRKCHWGPLKQQFLSKKEQMFIYDYYVTLNTWVAVVWLYLDSHQGSLAWIFDLFIHDFLKDESQEFKN